MAYRLNPGDPMAWMRLYMDMWRIALESQQIIAIRMAGMAGLWPSNPAERSTMVTEKIRAAQNAAFAMTRAAMTGASPVVTASRGLKPYGRRTRANSRRLTTTPQRRG